MKRAAGGLLVVVVPVLFVCMYKNALTARAITKDIIPVIFQNLDILSPISRNTLVIDTSNNNIYLLPQNI